MTIDYPLTNKKICRGCGKAKDTGKFYKQKDTRDKLMSICKTCSKKNANVWANEHRTKDGTDSLYREKYPERFHAWSLANKAEEDGILIRPDECEDCGNDEMTLHKHHEDYSKPLEIRWLCFPCHMKYHRFKGRNKFGDPFI